MSSKSVQNELSVRKRDGRVVSFERERIQVAIQKAFLNDFSEKN